MSSKWITPYTKQCFVSVGASINISQIGLVLGFATSLLPQLQGGDSDIVLDEELGSWVVSIPCLAMLLGNITCPTMMERIGRKKTHIISIGFALVGWVVVVNSNNPPLLLIGRFLQGISMGICNCLVPTIIGECSTPSNRGFFTMFLAFFMAIGTSLAHILGAYLYWKTTAIIFTVITGVDLVIVALSPETPSWLASRGRYEECRRVFRWLRGDGEEDELDKMIAASRQRALEETTSSLRTWVRTLISTSRDQAFYKPILIMVHLYCLGQWGGTNVLAPYITIMIDGALGKDVNQPAVIVSMGMHRLAFSFLSFYLIKKLKRRTMLFSMLTFNMMIWLVLGVYVYAKQLKILPFDHPAIGGLLLHLLMISIALGSSPMPFAIAGEIFPLRFRSYASGISVIFRTSNIFVVMKTFPFFWKHLGLYGTFFVYFGGMGYCLLVLWFTLPETKDRTLQDIEGEFTKKTHRDADVLTTMPLKHPYKLEEEC